MDDGVPGGVLDHAGNIRCYLRFGNERDVEHKIVVPGHGDEPEAGNTCRTPVRRGDKNMLPVRRNSRPPAIEPYGEQGFKIFVFDGFLQLRPQSGSS